MAVDKEFPWAISGMLKKKQLFKKRVTIQLTVASYSALSIPTSMK